MDKNACKLLRAAACLPLAVAATQARVTAQIPATYAEQEAGTWTFQHEHVLGTSLELKIHAANLAAAHRAEAAALAEIDRQDLILSAWRPDSEFSRWAATRFQPVIISPELFSVLAGFDHWREQTDGALDPSAEAAIRLWRQARGEGRTPSEADIAATIEAMQQQHWQLDPAQRTATRLTDVPLALASFAKSSISSHAADAAISAGATGIMLNIGGDVIARGTLRQTVDISDPRAASENDPPLDRVAVSNRAVATSGSYRRGIELASSPLLAPELSHIVDPRTALPTGHIASSTVIARDPETAGALATAFSVLSPQDSERLAARTPGVEYLLVTADGRQLRSPGWSSYQLPGLHSVAYLPAAQTRSVTTAGMWNTNFELVIGLEVASTNGFRSRRPYVAVWIEDADHLPVRTIALWTEKPRYIPELRQWYHDDQLRYQTGGINMYRTLSTATRPPGQYTLTWDGKDNEGKLVKAGKYTVVVEAAREHGSYQVQRREIDFVGQPQQAAMPAGPELGAVTLDYRKR